MTLREIERIEKEIDETQRQLKIKTILFLDAAQLCDPQNENDQNLIDFNNIDNEITELRAKLNSLQEQYDYVRALWVGCI